MRDDSPHSWMQAEVRAGAAREAPTVEALSVFRRLPTLPQGV